MREKLAFVVGGTPAAGVEAAAAKTTAEALARAVVEAGAKVAPAAGTAAEGVALLLGGGLVVAAGLVLGGYALHEERQEYEARVQAAMARLGLPRARDGRRLAEAYVYAVDMFGLQKTKPDAAMQELVQRDLWKLATSPPIRLNNVLRAGAFYS